MGLVQKGPLQYVTFSNLEDRQMVRHCFTTRLGGVSKGVYDSLNMGFSRGDNLEDVEKNYHIVIDALGLDEKSFIFTYQTHTTNIYQATEKDKGKELLDKRGLRDIDALITNVPGLTLTVFGADCVPLFFLDPVKKAIGLAHAGWRGTVMGIGKKTVQAMIDAYGTDPKDLLVGIGPSIGSCCFQVDEPVVSLFRQELSFWQEVVVPDETSPDHYKIDLWETNKKILEEIGVNPQQIEISGLCTMCHGDLFYSHRRMGEARGNMAGIMALLD